MTTLTMPTSPAPRASRFGLQSNTQVHESPLTRSVQTIGLTGSRWVAYYEFPPMSRADAAEWQAFLLKCDGRAGRFYGFDPDAKTPRGTWAGTALVNGTGQTGTALICDGFGSAATVKIGDYFTVNDELKMIVLDGTADASGNLTLTFRPSLRAAPSDDAPLTSSTATCIMMLADDDQAQWDADAISLFGIRFNAVEAFE